VVYLEFSDGQAHKFYQVTVDQTEVTIRYGRIGTQGQTSTSTYATPEAAQAEANKKIEEKLKKGYVRSQLIESPQFLRDLPAKFKPLKAFLEANLKPYITMTAGELVGAMNTLSNPTATGDPLTVWQSKIGGNPYFPKNVDYPTDPDSELAMPLLLQINCADVPSIKGFDFPQHGVLQFYLGFEPADAHCTPGKYQVLYFSEISENAEDLITDFGFIENRGTIREFHDDVYPLSFSASLDLFWEARYDYDTDIEIPEDLEELAEEFDEWLSEYDDEHDTRARGDKLGGYSDEYEMPDWTQGRLLMEFKHPFHGDAFHFVIAASQLSERDFSNVEFFYA
jgi:uncharacterized protein YwqG/predicted DNA-binding WGR domain protein